MFASVVIIFVHAYHAFPKKVVSLFIAIVRTMDRIRTVPIDRYCWNDRLTKKVPIFANIEFPSVTVITYCARERFGKDPVDTYR